MKKNQSGVSLITLVITIIVVIILAVVSFSSSTETITRAQFSNFTRAVGEVGEAFKNEAATLRGQETADGRNVTDAQAINFLAKGASLFDKVEQADTRDAAWLSRSISDKLSCTQLSGDAMAKALESKLPTTRVNTYNQSNVNVSYFVTREGIVFVWPPYEYDNEFYVNVDTKVTSGDSTTTVKASGDPANVEAMYKAGFSFKVGNVLVKVAEPSGDLATAATVKTYLDDIGQGAVDAKPSIFYSDDDKTSPVGIEAKAIYQATTSTNP